MENFSTQNYHLNGLTTLTIVMANGITTNNVKEEKEEEEDVARV